MPEQQQWLLALGALIAALVLVVAAWALASMRRTMRAMPAALDQGMSERHRAMMNDLHHGLVGQGDRLTAVQLDSSERLRAAVNHDLGQARDALQGLRRDQALQLAESREQMQRGLAETRNELLQRQELLRTDLLSRTLERLAEHSRADQELIRATMAHASRQLADSVEALTRRVDERLELITGNVGQRLDEGFSKTNETFANVMARLATIDEAQKKIDGLTTNVIGLQELLGDKRARGAFGEVQLEALVANMLPPGSYAMQYTLKSGTRADCMLHMPEPTGDIAVDSKFPLENYHRMLDPELGPAERSQAQRLFRTDVRAHVDAIASRYIVPGETADGAVMFVPAEAVFAEIHAHHPDVVEYAMHNRVWVVSPTTMMAVLNTARAVIKDVETRRQVHIIQDELSKLGREFGRFDERMNALARHIGQVHQDVEEVHKSSQKITRRFAQIERVELDPAEAPSLKVVDGDAD